MELHMRDHQIIVFGDSFATIKIDKPPKAIAWGVV
jgi:hypothetical protein